MKTVYPELVAAMAKAGVKRIEIAAELRITPRTLYSKLAGESDFTLSEADVIHSRFFPTIPKDELFARRDVSEEVSEE